jgi:tetratricopeptide (TPR) repeat protein
LSDAEDNESQVIRARLVAELAFVRYLQRRLPEAERLCRTAIERLKADVEQRPLAQASYVLDVVLVELGRSDEAVHASRALQIYEQLGDREEQGHVLNVLAWLAQTRWQWNEALSLYTQAGEAYERGGSQTGIAIAACNIGGILSDRGLFGEAETQLRRARRIWTATGERATAAYATLLLGRIAGRRLMIEEARSLLSQAAAELRALGETRDLEEAEIVLAEAEGLGGDASRAVAIATTLLASSNELPWLKRIRAIALARLGQVDEAIDELDSSLRIARERGALYDMAATLDVLQRLDPGSELGLADRDSILAQLGIEQLPLLELPPAAREPAVASSH